MRKGNIGVAPEGLPFLFLLALTALAFAALRFWPLALVFLCAHVVFRAFFPGSRACGALGG